MIEKSAPSTKLTAVVQLNAKPTAIKSAMMKNMRILYSAKKKSLCAVVNSGGNLSHSLISLIVSADSYGKKNSIDKTDYSHKGDEINQLVHIFSPFL